MNLLYKSQSDEGDAAHPPESQETRPCLRKETNPCSGSSSLSGTRSYPSEPLTSGKFHRSTLVAHVKTPNKQQTDTAILRQSKTQLPGEFQAQGSLRVTALSGSLWSGTGLSLLTHTWPIFNSLGLA